MIGQVIFFNPCNRGDLHISRTLVRETMRILRAQAGIKKFGYVHRHEPEILQDIPGLEYLPPSTLADLEFGAQFRLRDGVLALNTWYGCSPTWPDSGITLQTLENLFRHHLQTHFGLNLPLGDYRPVIQYEAFSPSYRKTVLFCNNPVLSGQSNVTDFTMNVLLQQIAKDFPGVVFLTTGPSPVAHNIVAASTMYPETTKCDLNQIAAVARGCDVIVGRSSGPFSFCLTADLLDDASKTFVTLVSDERMAFWAPAKAKILWHPSADDGLVDLLRGVLK